MNMLRQTPIVISNVYIVPCYRPFTITCILVMNADKNIRNISNRLACTIHAIVVSVAILLAQAHMLRLILILNS